MFKDKIVLVSGGTGSFGNVLVNKLINTEVKEIRIFSRDESKQESMRIRLNNDKVKFIIGDVREYSSIDLALENVDYVFHTSALKQVPSCEFFPMEAVKTNIIGSNNILDAAIKNNVSKVIVLSTDKSVYPTTSMGLTKALMEKVAISKARENNNTIFCITRFGNVIASRGSVIPLFIKQIKENKPLTITDINMSRFIMSLEEAVELVLFAFENGEQGDTFVQKSPACTVYDLAIALKELFNADNKIKYINIRHAEKIFETLVTAEEMSRVIENDQYYKIKMDCRNLNYNKDCDNKEIMCEEYNSLNTRILNVEEIKELLLGLEYIQNELKG